MKIEKNNSVVKYFTGFIVDDEVMCMEPYHDVHHYTNNHRPTMIGPNQNFIARAESTKSDNSLEEHGVFNRGIYRDAHSRIPSPHFIYHPQRESVGHEKSMETDNDAIQIIGEVELQHLPDAVSREIVKNSREIIFEEEPRESEPLLSREGSSSSMRLVNGKRISPMRYPVLLDEEKRLLSDSKRNLNLKNFPFIDEEKRSLNGSRRNLNGSKRYVLVSLDKAEGWNGSARNLNIGSKDNLINTRRHTESKEKLNIIKQNKKLTKELSDGKIKRKLIDINPSECHMPVHVAIEIDKQSKQIGQQSELTQQLDSNLTPSPSTDSITLPSEIIVAPPLSESALTPESGFADGQFPNSSPESNKREHISSPINSNILSRNRRSYEHAQLQDVNDILTRTSSGSSYSDSDGLSKDITPENLYSKQENPSPKPTTRQIISYTSV
ncbi:hypothetical protein PV326_005420 [Microctonus aethiopoides]|nr:hypothetical protein PV326_005420 [Microctonus aethiopoides]